MSNNSAPKITTTVLIVFPKSGGTNDIVLLDADGGVIQEEQRTYACNTARWVAQRMPIDE